MNERINQIMIEFWQYLPYLIGGISVLVVGWLLAWISAAIVRRLITRTHVDDQLEKAMGTQADKRTRIAHGVSSLVFWIILSLTVVGALSVWRLAALSDSLRQAVDAVLRYVPQMFAAAALLLMAWITARLLRWIIVSALEKAQIEKRLGLCGDCPADDVNQRAGDGAVPFGDGKALEADPSLLTRSIGDVVYGLVLLLFLPAILGVLSLQGILGPVQSMIDKVLVFLPNILVAGIILALGWFFASILRRVIIGTLIAMGADKLGHRVGLKSEHGRSGSMSHFVGWTAFLLLLIPVFLAALDTLRLQAVTEPTSAMLGRMLNAIPSIFAATLVLAIAYVVGQVVSQLVVKVLKSAHFDALPARLGLGEMKAQPQWAPSRMAGVLVWVAIVLFATMTSLELLGFAQLATLLTSFLYLSGHILLGLVVFGFGLFLASIVDGVITSRKIAHAVAWSLTARIAILFLTGAMALRQMGLADEIIALAFGLSFGAVAVAVAIAFGLGGREFAGRKLEEWEESLREKQGKPRVSVGAGR